MIAETLESIGDFLYVQLRQLGIVRCEDHGWTYVLDDTEIDWIRCPFCLKSVMEGDPEFEETKQKIIMWKFDDFCRPAPWTAELERELTEIVNRNRGLQSKNTEA